MEIGTLSSRVSLKIETKLFRKTKSIQKKSISEFCLRRCVECIFDINHFGQQLEPRHKNTNVVITDFVYLHIIGNPKLILSVYFQGVLKIRKRVTLTAVTVSIIFSICWMTDAVIFLLSYHSTTSSPSDVTWAIAAVMILFNSAINPFVYALINERFREKIKRLIGYRFRPKNQIQGATGPPRINLTTSSTQPTQVTAE